MKTIEQRNHDSEKPLVLVVDDDPGVLVLLSVLMRRAGYEVDAVAKAEHALELIDMGVAYDAILLDLMMPGFDGFDLMTWLNEHAPQLLSRVIIITALAPEEVAGVELSEIFCMFWKPFDNDEVVRMTARCVERGRAIAEATDDPRRMTGSRDPARHAETWYDDGASTARARNLLSFRRSGPARSEGSD